LRLAGLKTRAMGVRVASRVTCTAMATAWLANRVLELLRRRGAKPEIRKIRGRELTMLHRFCGKGYGYATQTGLRAVRRARDEEGLALDTTYTGKAMAAMLAFMGDPKQRHARALFVHTWAIPSPCEGPSAIPRNIERWLVNHEPKESP
jgi:D-cysteine desulfhydrase